MIASHAYVYPSKEPSSTAVMATTTSAGFSGVLTSNSGVCSRVPLVHTVIMHDGHSLSGSVGSAKAAVEFTLDSVSNK